MSDITFTGFTNPVKAAAACVRDMGVPMDGDSFARVAEAVGDKEPIEGFIVSYETLEKLCEMGNFVIAFSGGKVRAFTPTEWIAEHPESFRFASKAVKGEPRAWMRRWAFDRNEGTKGNRPPHWDYAAVTVDKLFDDDVALYPGDQP